MNTHTIEVRRRIAASQDKLFGAWTGPEAFRQWMCGPDVEVARVQVEARVGGTLRLDLRTLAAGQVIEHAGQYSTVERPERLAFTWTSEATGGAETAVAVSLAKHGASTDLVLTHAGLPSDASARYHAAAWAGMIDRLARYAGDTRTFTLPEALEVLRATPRALEALLGGLSAPWLFANEGDRSFNAHLVVAHLIHGERTDWIPRVRRILEHGDALAFEPFDRFARAPSERLADTRELARVFGELRAQNLATLEGLELTPEDMDKRGRHPELGPVTLGELLATWVVHDLGHLGQIARVMAKRYASDVGPWKAYSPILTR